MLSARDGADKKWRRRRIGLVVKVGSQKEARGRELHDAFRFVGRGRIAVGLRSAIA